MCTYIYIYIHTPIVYNVTHIKKNMIAVLNVRGYLLENASSAVLWALHAKPEATQEAASYGRKER